MIPAIERQIAAAKGLPASRVPTNRPTKGKTQPDERGADTAPVMPPPAFLEPETHLIGPYALSRAAGKHFPGRSRHTVTGPDSAGLTAWLARAIQSFINQHPTP